MDIVDLLSHAKHYEQHRKKIQQIMNKNTKLIDSKRMLTFNTFYTSRDKALKSQYKKKQQTVEKENDIILKKIVSVNQRKNQSFNPIRSSSHSNLTNLKRNIYNINQQNQLLAQKLVSARSNLKQEILRTSYQKHLQCKERLQKYQVDEQFGVIPKKFKSMQRIKKLTPILTKYQFGGRSRVASSEYSNQDR